MASGYGSDGVFRSPRWAALIASDPALTLSDLILRRAAACPTAPALIDAATERELTFCALRSAVLSVSAALSTRAHTRAQLRALPGLLPCRHRAQRRRHHGQPALHPARDRQARRLRPPPQHRRPSPPRHPPRRRRRRPLQQQRDPLFGPRRRGVGGGVPPPDAGDVAERHGGAVLLVGDDGGEQGRRAHAVTHDNFIAAAAAMVTSDQDELGEGRNVFLCFLPMFHIFGIAVVTLSQLQRGSTVVVMARFDVDDVLAAVERHRVTYLFCAPPVMSALAKHGSGGMYDVSSLRCIASGAAPLSKDVMEAVWILKFPDADIIQGYGMTETCGIISLEYQQKGHARQFGSTGALVTGVEAKIVDARTMKHLPPNQLGEICLRGPNIMQGYFNNLQATESTIKHGWLYTGDIGYFDERGQLYVVDRLKELIKYKGFQIAPAELEGLLLSHAEIFDAVVIPYPDPNAGEVPIAYVVRSPNSSLSEADVQKFIEKQVTYYKRLRKVTFVDSVPKSVSGKILRRELIAQVRSSKL